MKIIDTHCHLVSEKLRDDLPQILLRAQNAGVEKIINIAYNLSTSFLVLEHIKQSSMLYGALGIQPHDVSEYTIDVAEQIAALTHQSPRIVAIGEIGLDAYTPESRHSLHAQIVCFEHFLNIACQSKLPVVVHVRETHTETYDLIKHYSKRGLRGVIHCFTGTQKEASEFLDCGFYISFAGIVTFKNAQNVAAVAEYVPSDRILIETDSPYLAPAPLRGKINEPSFLAHTCAFLAQKRGLTREEFAHQTHRNSHDLFVKLNSSLT